MVCHDLQKHVLHDRDPDRRARAGSGRNFQPRKHTMLPLLHWEDYLQGFRTPADTSTSRLIMMPAGTYRDPSTAARAAGGGPGLTRDHTGRRRDTRVHYG